MDDLRLTQSEIYLSMTINKLLFRKISMKRKGLSDLKIKEVESTINDLNIVLNTFKTLEKEWRVARSRCSDLELHWLIAKKETNEQIKKNEELIKMI
jgi:hypothetical protein